MDQLIPMLPGFIAEEREIVNSLDIPKLVETVTESLVLAINQLGEGK